MKNSRLFLLYLILNFIEFTFQIKMNSQLTELKKELEEYGFKEDYIDLATKISQEKEEVLNL